jgi:hypothetical protein
MRVDAEHHMTWSKVRWGKGIGRGYYGREPERRVHTSEIISLTGFTKTRTCRRTIPETSSCHESMDQLILFSRLSDSSRVANQSVSHGEQGFGTTHANLRSRDMISIRHLFFLDKCIARPSGQPWTPK